MIEVADVFRRFAADYLDAHAASMPPSHRRAIEDILACRTAALGGQVWRCDACNAEVFSYHSCVMGEIRNGESAVAVRGTKLLSRVSYSPLRRALEHGDQFVRRPEGPFPEVRRHDRLDGFKLLGRITAGIDFGSCEIAMPQPKRDLSNVLCCL